MKENKLGRPLIRDGHPANHAIRPITGVHDDLVNRICTGCGWFIHQGALNWLRNRRPYGLQLRTPGGGSRGTNE